MIEAKLMQKSERTVNTMYPTIDRKKTGARIREIMRLCRITPAEVQYYLGLTCVQTVYRWLEGVNLPSVDNLYAMSCLFGVTVDDMLAGCDSRNGDAAVARLWHLGYCQFKRIQQYNEMFLEAAG